MKKTTKQKVFKPLNIKKLEKNLLFKKLNLAFFHKCFLIKQNIFYFCKNENLW